MKKYTTILLILLQLSIFAQTENKVKLIKFEPSECLDEDSVEIINDRIVSMEHSDKLLIIEIAVVADCCSGECGDIVLTNDTLNLLFHSKIDTVFNEVSDSVTVLETKVTHCSCLCCFHFKYYIEGLSEKEYFYKANYKSIVLSENKYKSRIKKFH